MTEDTPTARREVKTEHLGHRRRFGPFIYSPRRKSRARSEFFPAKAAGAIGLTMVAAHDLVYRQTGGDDFWLDLVSHAGADMLFLVTVPIVAVLVLIGQRGRAK